MCKMGNNHIMMKRKKKNDRRICKLYCNDTVCYGPATFNDIVQVDII